MDGTGTQPGWDTLRAHRVPVVDVVEINPGVDKSELAGDDILPFVAMSAVEVETGRIQASLCLLKCQS